MDSQRFDDLARLIGSGATRRRVIKGAFGSLVGLGVLRPHGGAALTVTPPCVSDDDCAENEICDPDTNECVVNCLGGGETCAPVQGQDVSGQGAIPCCEGFVCDSDSLTCEPADDGGCESDGDCDEGLTCCDGVCGDQLCPECERDEDCADGICCDGLCGLAECCGAGDSEHCAENEVCGDADGICRTSCETDGDCADDERCLFEGLCYGGFGPCASEDDCGDGSLCCDGRCTYLVECCAGTANPEQGVICCDGLFRSLECCPSDADPNAYCGANEICVEGTCEFVDEPEPGRATITIHLARCPTGTDDLFTDCHDDGIAGMAFTVTSAGEVTIADTAVVTTDVNGVAVATVGIGGVTIVQNGSVADAYLGSYIYCSEQDAGTVLYDGSADDATVSFVVADGDQVVCDWYGVTDAEDEEDEDDEDDGGDDDDGDDVSDLPDTGTGTGAAPAGGLSGWLGATALGAAAAALAGTKLRDKQSSTGLPPAE